MGATFSRLKNWTDTENLTNEDLNAEFNNILTNLTPSGLDDYSSNVTQMQTSTDPGESGSESLATSVAGEIERLRFAIEEIKGTTYWYETASSSISEIADALGGTLDTNRVASGPQYSGSTQSLFLIPNGAANSFVVDGTPTNVVYYVDGTAVTISSDLAVTGVSVAPASNNTALVNDPDLADQESTKLLGEYGTSIPIDNAGSEISALVGKWAAFSINNGSDTEYFMAYVKSTTELTECKRGWFFNSSSAAVPRIVFSDNDTITLLRLSWVFGSTAGAVIATTSEPTWSATEPSAPTTGDYWFDMVNKVWKLYSGGSFSTAGETLLGVVACDTSNCIAARSLDYAGTGIAAIDLELEKVDATQVRGLKKFSELGIYTSRVSYGYDGPLWDITANLESGVSESSSTMYYLYLDNNGLEYISDKIPRDRTSDLGGYTHPHHMWRCVGQVYNDSSSNFEDPQTLQLPKINFPTEDEAIKVLDSSDSTYTQKEGDELLLVNALSDDITINLLPAVGVKGRNLKIKRTDNHALNVDTFADGDVTTGTDNINVSSHPFSDLEKVQVSNSGGALPTGLTASTDYWVIYVDADNIKLASSRANAVADTAVDITAAAGGGTHTIQSEARTITIDGDGSETIDGSTTGTITSYNETIELVSDGTGWSIINRNGAKNKYQIKYLSSDLTADTNPITDLTFSNLIIGKSYSVYANVAFTGISSGEGAAFNILHDGNTLATYRYNSGGTGSAISQGGIAAVFTATTSTVTFEFNEQNVATLSGNGTAAETFTSLEELNGGIPEAVSDF